MKTTKQQGFTLIDLLLALGIMAITFGVAIPSFSDLVNRNRIESESAQLKTTLQLARKTAITEHKKVTVCPTLDENSCTKDWSDGYMAFIDLDEDRILDGDEKVLYQGDIRHDDISLRWKAFGRRSSLQWHETGITNHQNGSFEFCFREQPKLSRALIITKAGRIRKSKDKNNDGIHENSRGKNLSC